MNAERIRRCATCAVLAGMAASTAEAQITSAAAGYPSKSIRIVVPYAPGGLADLLCRAVGQKLNEAWGQPVVIDNRPGAGTNLGNALVARSAPDGYVLLAAGITNAINPSLYAKLDYDPIRDFAMITSVAKVPLIVAAHPSLPARGAKELVALARARPQQLTFASAGNGSSGHLAGELFKSMTQAALTHIPYKGSAPALNNVMGGHVDTYFGAVVSVLPHVRSNRLRAIGMTSLKRTGAAPDLPTLDEQGIRGFDTTTWYALAAPAGTPPAIVGKIQQEVARIIGLPEVRERFAAEGAEFVGSTPAEFTEFVKTEAAKWARVVKVSGARID